MIKLSEEEEEGVLALPNKVLIVLLAQMLMAHLNRWCLLGFCFSSQGLDSYPAFLPSPAYVRSGSGFTSETVLFVSVFSLFSSRFPSLVQKALNYFTLRLAHA